MNLSEIETIYEKLKNIVKNFENGYFDSRVAELYLANGNTIKYNINNNFVPHLLGVDTNYLVSTNMFKPDTSMKILNEMLNKDSYWLYNQAKNKNIDLNKVFSPYILKKLECFLDNIKICFNNTLFVCEFDRKILQNRGLDVEKYDYIICKKNNEKYEILCLVQNNYYYAPISNQLFDTEIDLIKSISEKLNGQSFTLFTGGHFFNKNNDYDKRISLSVDSKISSFNNIKKYATMFNSKIDVSNDYLFCLNKYNEYLNKFRGSSETEVANLTKDNNAKAKKIFELEEKIKFLNQNLANLRIEKDNLTNQNSACKKKILKIKEVILDD